MSDASELEGAEAAALLSGDEEGLRDSFAEQEYQKAVTLDQGGTEIMPPGTVTLSDGSSITSDELQSIIYTSVGVVIVGRWDHDDPAPDADSGERANVLIPWDKVLCVEFNLELMVELLQERIESDES